MKSHIMYRFGATPSSIFPDNRPLIPKGNGGGTSVVCTYVHALRGVSPRLEYCNPFYNTVLLYLVNGWHAVLAFTMSCDHDE